MPDASEVSEPVFAALVRESLDYAEQLRKAGHVSLADSVEKAALEEAALHVVCG